ncbi:MAG TPA: DUF6165 family protein [Acetobacteraceae bacterium]|nr:DUF6165 family protein [Acetobacteraceae bacterium]
MADPPLVPVSWGELLDKITILEIKRARLRSPEAVVNTERELAALAAVLAAQDAPDGLPGLKRALTQVNESLWDIENAIRAKEAAGDFGAEFVALARSVYRQNDERGRIKRAINVLLGSRLIEEKQYTQYPT